MIPNLQVTNNEDSGIKHATCAEMNRGRMIFLRWGILANMEVCPIHDDEFNTAWGFEDKQQRDFIAGHMRYFISLGFVEFDVDKWRITGKGRAALEEYRNATEGRR
jgi:hypothetical protein